MELFLQLLVNSVVVGSVAALVTLGFSLILNVTNTLHFAHGSIYTASAYVVYLTGVVLAWPAPIAVLLGIAGAVALGVLSEVIVYAPLRRPGIMPRAILISSLGILILVQNAIALAFGSDVKSLAAGYRSPVYEIGPVVITGTRILIVVTAVVGSLSLAAFLRFSRWGRVLRAVASNPLLAEISGIDRRKVYILTFAAGSALAAPAAILLAFDTGLSPSSGIFAVLLAVTAAIIGGVGSLPGSLLGAYVVA